MPSSYICTFRNVLSGISAASAITTTDFCTRYSAWMGGAFLRCAGFTDDRVVAVKKRLSPVVVLEQQ